MDRNDDRVPSDESLMDVIERIRNERFPNIDRELVRELLRIHAEPATSEVDLTRAIDDLIIARTRS